MNKYEVKHYDVVVHQYVVDTVYADSYGAADTGILRFYTKKTSDQWLGENTASYAAGEWSSVKLFEEPNE